jgi:hypothetical protein
MINLDKYSKLKKKRNEIKKKSYKKVLKQIISEVESIMIQDIDFIVFEVEPFLIGVIEYDMLECIDYVINKINKDESFKKILAQVNFFEPNILYIKWDLSVI